MSISLSSEIIQTVREFLDIDYEITPSDLYEKLYQYRSKTHPDLFIDKDEKSAAENRFKDCYKYLDELSDYINKDRMINPKELTVYDKEFEMLQRRQEMIKMKKNWKDIRMRFYFFNHQALIYQIK